MIIKRFTKWKPQSMICISKRFDKMLYKNLHKKACFPPCWLVRLVACWAWFWPISVRFSLFIPNGRSQHGLTQIQPSEILNPVYTWHQHVSHLHICPNPHLHLTLKCVPGLYTEIRSFSHAKHNLLCLWLPPSIYIF